MNAWVNGMDGLGAIPEKNTWEGKTAGNISFYGWLVRKVFKLYGWLVRVVGVPPNLITWQIPAIFDDKKLCNALHI